MTPAEAFQFGFLARCVEMGLSSDETQQRAEKVAHLLEKRAFGIGDAAAGGQKALLTTAALAAGLPIAAYGAGRFTGQVAADATAGNAEDDIEWAKQQELRDEYDRRIAEMRKLQLTRGISGARKPSGRRVGF